MKSLLVLAMLAMSVGSFAGTTMREGPRVVGNGGGGVKTNGVYKTFYSAGIYVSEELDEVPGGELYTSTIQGLIGEGMSTTKLIAAGLPYGERKFYKISESQMDEKTMSRLLEEYAKVVDQPADGLTIFAVTDIEKKSTYLLPSFFKLNEVEQASILFHEAYWILKPSASYSEVVGAEMAFQKYVEGVINGKYEVKLPRLLGSLLKDPSIPLKTAMEFDRVSQAAPNIIGVNGKIKFSNLFVNTKKCEVYSGYTQTVENMFGRKVSKEAYGVQCSLNKEDVRYVLEKSRKNQSSMFLAELVSFLTTGNEVRTNLFGVIKGEGKPLEKYMAIEKGVESMSIDSRTSEYTGARYINIE